MQMGDSSTAALEISPKLHKDVRHVHQCMTSHKLMTVQKADTEQQQMLEKTYGRQTTAKKSRDFLISNIDCWTFWAQQWTKALDP